MTGFLHLQSAAAMMRVSDAELQDLLARGVLKAEPGTHGGEVIAESAVMAYLASRQEPNGNR